MHLSGIYVQLIWKTTASYIKNYGRIGVPFMQYYAKIMAKLNSLYFFPKLSKIKIQKVFTSLIYEQLICKTATSYFKNCRRSYP